MKLVTPTGKSDGSFTTQRLRRHPDGTPIKSGPTTSSRRHDKQGGGSGDSITSRRGSLGVDDLWHSFNRTPDEKRRSSRSLNTTRSSSNQSSFFDGIFGKSSSSDFLVPGLPMVPFDYAKTYMPDDLPQDPLNEAVTGNGDLNEKLISNGDRLEVVQDKDRRRPWTTQQFSPTSSASSLVKALISSQQQHHDKKNKLKIGNRHSRSNVILSAEAPISPGMVGSRNLLGRTSVTESPLAPSSRHSSVELFRRKTALLRGDELLQRRYSSEQIIKEITGIPLPSSIWVPCMSRHLLSAKESQSLILRYDRPQQHGADQPQQDHEVGSTAPFSPFKNRGLLVIATKAVASGNKMEQTTKLASIEPGVSRHRRVLRDANGNRCAVIVRFPKNSTGRRFYKIYGERPMSSDHRRSNETGLYTWGTVKNTGGMMGVQFSMKMRNAGKDMQACHKYVTESFGQSLFSRSADPQGYAIRAVGGARGGCIAKQSSLVAKAPESSHSSSLPDDACAQLTYLNDDSREIQIDRNVDLSLMICFAAIIDEMVEKRIR